MSDQGHQVIDMFTEALHLGKLLDKLEQGWMRIPQFQRPFAWSREQMRDLLDTIQHRFPIGSILVWETSRKVASHERIGPITVGNPAEKPNAYVLDGQQRVTTLLGTLRLPKELAAAEDRLWAIYYDLQTKTFVHLRSDEPVQAFHLPVRTFLGTYDFLKECSRIAEGAESEAQGKELVATAERVADVFRNYQIPVIRVTNADLPAAVTIFTRLNTRGRRMTPDQLVSVLTYEEEAGGFHLDAEIDRILEILANYGFGGIDRLVVLRAILAAAEKDIYFTDWTNLVEYRGSGSDLRQPIQDCERALKAAVDFLRGEGVESDRLLPYSLQLVLLSEFFRNATEPSEATLTKLRRWFWVTSFTGWFATFSSAKARQAIDEMRALAEDEGWRIDSLKHDEALPFPERFDGRSARVRAFLLYLMSLKPLSLDRGEPLDSGGLLSQLGPQALHYIFSRELPSNLYPSPANRILLGASHRGQARGALLDLPAEREVEILKSHGIPADSLALLREGDSEAFIRRRLEFLIDGEREFMRQRQVTPPPSRETAEPEPDSEDEEG